MPAAFTLDDLRALLVRCAHLPPGLVVDDPSTPFDDLGVDSVGLVALQAELADRYGVRLDASAAPFLTSVGAAVDHIDRLIRRR
jgi:acyl carrier protein